MAGVKVIMVTGDNLITAVSIGKECNILPQSFNINDLNLTNLETSEDETNNDSDKKSKNKAILDSRPCAMTGNTFYSLIEGIYCQTCGNDTDLCKCPKSEAEAKELAKHSKDKVKKEIKKDAIKNMNNFMQITPNLLVMARSQPIHKYALVLGLKELGNVVAVTGDGTNDAPALSRSDVGFAMADGTDIAKDASDIIIMDNNFSSIVIAIIYGRSIYENIRKFLQFQLTVNFSACILVFICSCIGNETPLNSIQMLWVNLIMDSLGSLALATEPPYDELLNKKPTDRNESIINGIMWKHIAVQSTLEIVLLLGLYFYAPVSIIEDKREINEFAKKLYECFGELPGNAHYLEYNNRILYGNKNKWDENVMRLNEEKCKEYGFTFDNMFGAYSYYQNEYGGTTHMTLIFDVFVVYTLFNQINCRIIDDSINTFKRISKGIMFCLVTLGEFFIQILLSEFGFKVFHCVKGGLSLRQWAICIFISILTMIFNFLIKFIPLELLIKQWMDKYGNFGNKDAKIDINSLDQMTLEYPLDESENNQKLNV